MDDLAVVGEDCLRAAGKRITHQRRLLLRVLAEAGCHLDACEVYDRARRLDRRLCLGTVYRTLGTLKEAGVVRELHLDEEHHHYELDKHDHHSHLVCLECGRVIEVDSHAFVEAVQAISQTSGFAISSAQVEMTGYCAECRVRRQGNEVREVMELGNLPSHDSIDL